MNSPVYPCLWFETEAKSAVDYYCSIFQNSKITSASPMVVIFELNGTKFMALNGKQKFKFNESVSFVIECNDQKEIDHYWYKLSLNGEENMCGWLKDRYGVSWQIVPKILSQLMSDPERSESVMNAFLKMKKFEIEKLLDI